MKLNNIHIKAFGRLQNVDLDLSSSNIVVVYGRNEAGKSTLFHLLESILYGFYPVKDYPYRPWHLDSYPEYNVELTLDDGRDVTVYRKLMATPKAHWTEGDKVISLRNKNLPFVNHVTRDLYQSLYAIKQANVRYLEEAQRSEIEDRLLGSLSSDAIRPAREVADELADEAHRLWRPDQRGNQEMKKLRQQLKDIREKRKDAEEVESELRGHVEELENVQEKIAGLQHKTDELNARIRKADVLLPARKRIEHIEELKSQIPDLEAAEKLSPDLRSQFQRWHEKEAGAQRKLASLEEEHSQKKKQVAQFTDYDRHILDRSDTLKKWCKTAYSHFERRETLNELENKFENLRTEIDDIAIKLFSTTWNEEYRAPVRQLDLNELKSDIDWFQNYRSQLRQLETNKAPATSDDIREIPPSLHRGLTIAGTILALGGVISSIFIVLLIGIFVAIAGGLCFAFNLYLRYQKNILKRQQEKRGNLKLENTEAEIEKIIDRIETTLSSLPIRKPHLENPDTTLYEQLRQLQFLLKKREETEKDLEEKRTDWEQEQKELKELTEELGEPNPDIEAINRLEERLEQAKEHRRTSREANRRIEQIECEKQELTKTREESQERLNKLRAMAADALKEELPEEQAINAAEKIQEKITAIQQTERQLTAEHGSISDLRKEIEELERYEKMPLNLDETEVESARSTVKDMQEKLAQLREQKASLETRIRAAREHVSIGEIDGEIMWIKEQMENVRREHDRLMLMRSILLEADRQFREKHQPDVLKRASKYLNKITGGRYRSLTTMQTPDGTEELTIVGESGEHHPVSFPLSGGTLDQIYLSFRLAVIEHLDQNTEHLPLVMDEVLINWDDERFERGQEIIANVSEGRQVFLLTCHNWIADRIMKALPAVNIKL